MMPGLLTSGLATGSGGIVGAVLGLVIPVGPYVVIRGDRPLLGAST